MNSRAGESKGHLGGPFDTSNVLSEAEGRVEGHPSLHTTSIQRLKFGLHVRSSTVTFALVLRCADGSLYIGHTNDPRLESTATNSGTATALPRGADPSASSIAKRS